MMIFVLLFLSSLIYTSNSCFPSSPIVTPTPPPPPPPCQRCPLLKKDEFVKQTITIVNGCAVLTLTVTGIPTAPNAVLEWNNVNTITVALPGSATLVTQCNAASMRFEYMGTIVTSIFGMIY
ncbi:hypothetical protein PRIPAC_87269 [Pristionchus pacificus]|uniref:Uncharacterized protein n=1 Tax=Pristionchus pacificus TaxID=54126 RepID=A0A2A6CYL8_PRIPA|nr:hypothetical protein PRIPAC_87269 [Pristionchus pacificus]|eukprot:PDM83265.1 hypothetical protein PRIPAC_34897 [Pristionchus pacificus]